MDLDASKPMSEAEIQAATSKYSHLVGESLANCTAKKGFYVCLDAIKNADDKARFNFKRYVLGAIRVMIKSELLIFE